MQAQFLDIHIYIESYPIVCLARGLSCSVLICEQLSSSTPSERRDEMTAANYERRIQKSECALVTLRDEANFWQTCCLIPISMTSGQREPADPKKFHVLYGAICGSWTGVKDACMENSQHTSIPVRMGVGVSVRG